MQNRQSQERDLKDLRAKVTSGLRNISSDLHNLNANDVSAVYRDIRNDLADLRASASLQKDIRAEIQEVNQRMSDMIIPLDGKVNQLGNGIERLERQVLEVGGRIGAVVPVVAQDVDKDVWHLKGKVGQPAGAARFERSSDDVVLKLEKRLSTSVQESEEVKTLRKEIEANSAKIAKLNARVSELEDGSAVRALEARVEELEAALQDKQAGSTGKELWMKIEARLKSLQDLREHNAVVVEPVYMQRGSLKECLGAAQVTQEKVTVGEERSGRETRELKAQLSTMDDIPLKVLRLRERVQELEDRNWDFKFLKETIAAIEGKQERVMHRRQETIARIKALEGGIAEVQSSLGDLRLEDFDLLGKIVGDRGEGYLRAENLG